MDANMEQASCSAPQRLVITEMVLENFKSYAGEQRVGPFHKARALYRKGWHLCFLRGRLLGSHVCMSSSWCRSTWRVLRQRMCAAHAVLLFGGGPERQRQEQRH